MDGTVTMPEKLSAFGKLLRHLSPQQQELNGERFAYCIASIFVIMSPHSTNYQRAHSFPEWREHLSVAAIGAVSDRNAASVRRWRNGVLDKDGYQCVDCGSSEELEAHHIVRWADNVFLRADPDNGMTLCHDCHLEIHGRLH
jgi:hypothetical protein